MNKRIMIFLLLTFIILLTIFLIAGRDCFNYDDTLNSLYQNSSIKLTDSEKRSMWFFTFFMEQVDGQGLDCLSSKIDKFFSNEESPLNITNNSVMD